MTRFKGRWLDDEEPGDPDEIPARDDLRRPSVAQWFRAKDPDAPPVELPPPPPNAVSQWLDPDERPPVKGDDRPARFGYAAVERSERPYRALGALPPRAPHGEQADETARGRHREHPVPQWTYVALGVGGLFFAVGALLSAMGNTNIAGGLIMVPILAWIAYTLANRFALHDAQPAIVPILMGGLAVKMVGVALRYLVAQQVYGRSDATEYAFWGRQIAAGLRSFEMVDIGRWSGTNFVRYLTGIVFAITPGTTFTGYVVFGFFAYLGMILFWRAYRMAVSEEHDLKYLQVVMVLPSLAFWPSSLGKDAWMVLGVGAASYGVACVLVNRTLVGWVGIIAGSAAISAVRPHVGVPIFVGLLLAELFRRRGSQGVMRAGFSMIFIAVVGLAVLQSAAGFLGVENLSQASITQELDSVASRTAEGRAQFTPTPVKSPVHFPPAAFAVMYRPMPIEARSPQEFASALENVTMIVLTFLALKKIGRGIANPRMRPYVLFCIGVLITFVVEYSSFSNFALIARQRTQVTALFLALLLLPKAPEVEVDEPRVRDPGRSQSTPDPA
jgi:hypothetical protein